VTEQSLSHLCRYTPGSWINDVGGKKRGNYVIPKTTTLLLVGAKGSGKSSLVNRISRVFEDDKFASERAQVTCIFFFTLSCRGWAVWASPFFFFFIFILDLSIVQYPLK